jgi:hypothetical protein
LRLLKLADEQQFMFLRNVGPAQLGELNRPVVAIRRKFESILPIEHTWLGFAAK